MAEKTLGARITLADRMSNGMMRIIQTVSRVQSTAERMNQTTQKMGHTMQSASNQASNGMNKMSNAANAAAAGASKLESATNKAANATEKAGSAAERAAQRWNQLGEKYGTTNRHTTAMMDNLDQASHSLQTTGMAATAAGAGLAYGFGQAINKAADFEAQMSSIKSLGVVGQDFDQLKQLAIDAGAATKYSALEAGQAIEELQKAGVSVADILSGGLYGALDLATAGELDLAEAAEIASTALNAYKADNLSVARAGDLLAGAANASATKVRELKFGLSMVSAVASGVGQKFEDTATGLALFANNGLKGSDAGTSFKTMLMNLTPKTKDQFEAFEDLGLMSFNTQKALQFLTENGVKPASTSTKDVVDAMMTYTAKLEGAKVGTDRASKAFRDITFANGIMGSSFYDQNGNLRDLASIAGELQNALKDMTAEQRQMALYTMFGSDAIRAGNILYKEGAEGVRKMNAEMNKVTAAQVAAEKLNNLKGAVEQLNGAVETAKITIGNMFLPVLTVMAQGVNVLVDAFNALPGPLKAALVAMTLMATALLIIVGPLVILSSFIPAIVNGIGELASLLGTTSGALMGMAKNALFLVGRFILLVGAIAAIASAFSILYSKSETFRNFVNGLFSSISKTVEAAVKQITDLGKGLWGYILVWWKQDGEKIRNAAHKIIDPLKKMWNGLSDAAKPAFEEMKNVVFYVWTAIEDNFYSGLDIILGAISILADVINGDFSGAWNTLKETIDKVVNRFTSAQWVTDLKDAFVSFKNDAVDYVNDAIETLTTTYEKHQGAIKTTATILGVIFGPSLILVGVRATVAGAQITAGFIAAVVKAGYEAMIAGAKIAGEFVVSLIKSGWAAVVAAAKLTGSLVIALGRVALQATITAGTLAGKLVVSLFQAARAGWAFNIALLANPMTWVVIGIIALIAAIVLLVKNWDTVKAKVLEVWESIKTKTSEAITAIKTTISEWINTAIQVGKDFLSGVATGFMNGIETVVSAAKSVWERIKSVFTSEPITVSPDVQYQGPLVGPPAPRPYANGGLIDRPHLGLVGEAGPEMIVPLSASRRGRGLELWQQAGQMLGAIPYANGGLVGTRNVPERQKPSKPPSGMRGVGGKGAGGRGAGPMQNTIHISITGDQVAAMGEDKGYMRKVVREMAEEFLEEIMEAADNYTIDNLGTMME